MGCCGKLMMRVGPLVLSLDGKLLGPRRMTKKINVHPEWKILQTLTNGAKRKLDHLLLHLVNGLLWKTNDESGTPRSQSGWKTSWAKKDDKEDQCASRVEDSSNTNQWGKKEAGSSPSSSGKWAANECPLCRGTEFRAASWILVAQCNDDIEAHIKSEELLVQVS
ncbi:hypothetical protein Tco_0363774 [Tanacetum coccineum]